MQWIGGVGVLGEKCADFGVDGGFPVGVEVDVEEDPAGWRERE
jgi:hypothetical protein